MFLIQIKKSFKDMISKDHGMVEKQLTMIPMQPKRTLIL